ncbi:acyl-CoA dehydrogenase [Actinoallomurus iriomotensis]|uniref:Acyl-CoA dehydrogenase n=1 Tax=Actinoallomurus iriomotensis TaxID=478107 RepID=A0A9W6VMI2_9ACTN|nr:acyl-CoA dehydrogenase [Actinoallomurus iriomotensis]GLY77663.1 acyl-CoA dehydrogenase [Actinoallomurus iriomotensis]
MTPWQRHVEQRFTDVAGLRVPLPGSGETRERWALFALLAEEDLSLARLSEGHFDALAILAELNGPRPAPGDLWGVWAAKPPSLEADGGRVSGVKPYCSGARVCTRALVTAGDLLFAVEPGEPVEGTWPATGMAASDSLDVRFEGVPAEQVGPPGGYTGRPGFHHGGVGVAAVWYGGARAVARPLLGVREPHALAHLGAVEIALTSARDALERAADEIDADPLDHKEQAAARALRVRSLVAEVAAEVLDRTGRALGAGPLSHDEAHARRVADLTVYIRQHHAERDLAALGAMVTGDDW